MQDNYTAAITYYHKVSYSLLLNAEIKTLLSTFIEPWRELIMEKSFFIFKIYFTKIDSDFLCNLVWKAR